MEKIIVDYRTVEGVDLKLEIDQYSRTEIEALKERIRQGIDKMNDVWKKLMELDHESQVYKATVSAWDAASRKLNLYCQQLENMGFQDCLFIKEGKKTRSCLIGSTCHVCPSHIQYWATEWDLLPSASDAK